MWNVVGLIYGTLCCVVGYYDKQQRASTSAYVVTSVSGLLGMCSIFLFLIPLYNIPYWSACFTKTLLFFLYTLVVLSQAQYKKDILQFWFFSALLAYALHYSFTLYNTYRFVRDASTSVVYALCCFALATNWTACSLAKKNWKGQKDEYKNEKLLHITCCVAFNVLLVCMMFLAMFPSYDPLLYEPDVYLGDNSGGFSIYRASQPALFVLLSILPTSVLCQQETAVEISSWVELLCRSIVTIAACMDLFWLERVPS